MRTRSAPHVCVAGVRLIPAPARNRKPEAVFVDPQTGAKERVFIVDALCDVNDINLFGPYFMHGTGLKRAGIEHTLHRLSFTTHPAKPGPDGHDAVVAVTARVGRAFEGVVARMVPFLLTSTQSLLIVGRPGVGKTTLLRELARCLSADMRLQVCVVDKTWRARHAGVVLAGADAC